MCKCDTCRANKVCDHNNFGFENCNNYIPSGGWRKETFLSGSKFIRCPHCGAAIDCTYSEIDENEFTFCPYCGRKVIEEEI